MLCIARSCVSAAFRSVSVQKKKKKNRWFGNICVMGILFWSVLWNWTKMDQPRCRFTHLQISYIWAVLLNWLRTCFSFVGESNRLDFGLLLVLTPFCLFIRTEQQLHNLDCDWVVLKEAVTVKDLLLCMVLVSTQIRFAEVLNVSLLLVRKLMQRRHTVSLFLRVDSKDMPWIITILKTKINECASVISFIRLLFSLYFCKGPGIFFPFFRKCKTAAGRSFPQFFTCCKISVFCSSVFHNHPVFMFLYRCFCLSGNISLLVAQTVCNSFSS